MKYHITTVILFLSLAQAAEVCRRFFSPSTMAQSKRNLTVDEILQELEDDEKDISRLYIEPPEPNVESDEDSADEDEGGMLDNLTGRQLRAGAEVLFANNARTQLDPELSTDDAEGDNCKPSKKNEKRKRNQRKQRKWGKHDLCNSLSHFLNFKNEPDPAVTKAELKVFIAVLILSGYNRLPGKRFYWDSGPDMRNEMVHAAIRRDRTHANLFGQLLRESPPRGPAGKSLAWVFPPPQAVFSRSENQVHSLLLCGHTEVAQSAIKRPY
ncbi:piggyBac transposable element-derived protein 3-like [Portunus trituberculatus]|uniref:piggyBac transposable element-derived protein 3-like n=1 Tax=Portunus trituberculatus TaxID=210409 RepID=UPI001E1CFB51|nr:piggyBac transposable element-derived protein 3-like [Portunus trituberculatus]